MNLRKRVNAAVSASVLFITVFAQYAPAQTNPSPLSLPVSQDWQSVTFPSLPSGFAAWNGLSGQATDTQAKAEASAPTGNATVSTSWPPPNGAGGCYGYAVGSDKRFAVQTSSN